MIRFLRSLSVCLGLSVALTTTLFAQGPVSYHTQLFGTINPDTSSLTVPWRYSALTGYAGSNGREYALLGGFQGTYIIDVTEAPIKQVAFIPGPNSGWRELKTYSSYAYIVSEGGAGLQVVDLSGLPGKATLLLSDTTVFRSAHTITSEGRFLYVNGSNVQAGANGGTLIFDVATNPKRPKHVGTWSGHYVHDAQVRNDTMYAAAINNGQLDIIYLGKDRAAPKEVTEITYPGAGTHNVDLSGDGRYILTTDEIGPTPKTLKVWDRSDISSIEKVADWTPVPGQIIHNVHILGRRAYIAWYTAGTRIVDISDPTHPVQVGFYDTYPGASEDYAGNWGVYPYLPSGKILSSDMQTGLYVTTFDGALPGSVSGIVRDAVTGDPVPNAEIVLPGVGYRITADSLGVYRYDGAIDTLDFVATAQNYLDRSGKLEVLAGGNTTDILLSSLPLADLSLDVVDNVTNQDLEFFSYRVVNRTFGEGVSKHNPEVLVLPQDSAYDVIVGAWGYHSKTVRLDAVSTGTQTVRLDPGYYDDAEVDLGWSFDATGDDAVSGIWERGKTVGTFASGQNGPQFFQPDTDATSGLGDHAFVTGLNGSPSEIGADDVDGGVTTLTSPLFDLTSYVNPYIYVSIWYSRDGNTQAIDDTLLVLLSNDDGLTWKRLASITDSSDFWRPYEFNIPRVMTPTSSMLFRVVASDLGDPSLVEAAIDDFSVVDRDDISGFDEVCFYGDGRLTHGTVAPNPMATEGALHLRLDASQEWGRIALYNELGERVELLHEGTLDASGVFPIDASHLSPGRYIWRLELADGTMESGMVTVMR